jgi:hypothetical protein
MCYKPRTQEQGRIAAGRYAGTGQIRFAGFEVWRPFTRFWPWQRIGKFGLNRFKSRLQALVDGHEFETLNPFASQYEGRKMKGIQCSQ